MSITGSRGYCRLPLDPGWVAGPSGPYRAGVVSAVEVQGLTVRYGDLVAVDGISFRAEHGQVTAVLGPNGAGKTSTIEVCEGYRRPTSGTVRVLGLDPTTQQAQLSERMGVMLQEGGVSPTARVADTVRHYCALYERGVRADELITTVGLTERTSSTWRRLSGGEKQRLSLALALAARPEVAFLDEPTSGVDVHGRDTIRAIVRDLAGSGCAVVLATHELDEAERLADRVVIFDRGQVIADGTLDELRRGHDEIRFRSAPGLDLAALATATGLTAGAIGDGEYRIVTGSDPQVVARLTGWLGEQGHPLLDLRAGAQRLEDVFRRLTARDEPGSSGDAGPSGATS
jgi:ABC-2 type transport system ATP-binding protein